MANSRNLFQKDKELSQQWAAVSHSDWYAKVLIFARSEFMEHAPSSEAMTGARAFEVILSAMSDAEESAQPIPHTGLVHDLESIKPEIKPKRK